MREELQPLIGTIVTGTAVVKKVLSDRILLRRVRILRDIEYDHCWVFNCPRSEAMQVDQMIQFLAIVISYETNYFGEDYIDYGMRILWWEEIALG